MTDVVLSLPVLLLALGLASACGATKEGCLGGTAAAGAAARQLHHRVLQLALHRRIVRGQVLSIREKEFVEASRSQGAGQLPHHAPRGAAERGGADHRLHDPDHPEQHPVRGRRSRSWASASPTPPRRWGRALSDASGIFTVAWWMMLFPGLVLFTITLAFNLVGDGLRDALDPRTAR